MSLFSALGADHKDYLDPFTGAFVSRLPLTVSSLRLAIHALSLPEAEADAYLRSGASRLRIADSQVHGMVEAVAAERRGWHQLYDRIEEIDEGLSQGSLILSEVAAEIAGIVNEAEVS